MELVMRRRANSDGNATSVANLNRPTAFTLEREKRFELSTSTLARCRTGRKTSKFEGLEVQGRAGR
jgi:hypothetical protein